MIIAGGNQGKKSDFRAILDLAVIFLEKDSKNNPNKYLNCSSSLFEKHVFAMMRNAAKKTVFKDTIKLIAGYKFPDIIAKVNFKDNGYYGVEVKKTIKNHWKTTGNSVLESTRIDGVESIYFMFGKLIKPIEFKIRKYEDCLYDVAVTHSPRYLVDMELKEGESIFDKMKLPYDKLRKKKNPISKIIEYYQENKSKADSIWWLSPKRTDKTLPIAIQMWSGLSHLRKRQIIAKAFALFPDVFAISSPKKYDKVASWLVKEHGIVSSSLRDSFSAGGKTSFKYRKVSFKKVPQVYGRFIDMRSDVFYELRNMPLEVIAEYWGIGEKKISEFKNFDCRFTYWQKVFKKNSEGCIGKKAKVLVENIENEFNA